MGAEAEFAELTLGRLTLRAVRSDSDMAQVADLRKVRFRDNKSADLDAFDPLCTHLLITEAGGSCALACARLRLLAGPEMDRGYSAQFYDLAPLVEAGMRALELGRICIADERRHDPDILRILLCGIAAFSEAQAVDLLIGCASFKGDAPTRHGAALGLLRARHIGPHHLRPRKRDPLAFDLPAPGPLAEQKAALQSVPPLLRMYLGMGGWVSDHAVRDPALDTLHVFTAVEIARIPPGRKRLLTGMGQGR
ncbi:GNAT family N-acetyltransferase [Roseibaca sp. Y0-43]|uniref:GNAT family N-acetyltransferase n=1 Tax=Roseibaca sp. Y0-43 TaxID=2816854 RepID=UPI001D0C3C22|nr:GNAT family N-acyltransferase [Roseibaca sp. Y0-43]MCC1481507.1 GNAT family N-acetyltransferase [Roseibaca sp. Y0-43]